MCIWEHQTKGVEYRRMSYTSDFYVENHYLISLPFYIVCLGIKWYKYVRKAL